MARSSLKDPLDKFRWTVSIEGFTRLGFHTTSVPSYTITTKKYKEGGAHLTPKQIPDSFDYKPVVLSRGLTNDTSFNKWATSYFDLVTNNAGLQKNDTSLIKKLVQGALNNGSKAVPSFTRVKDFFNIGGNLNLNYRKTVKIEHINRTGQVDIVYILYGAYPIEYTPASDFGATSDDGVSIESITLAYEGFEVQYTGFAGTIAGAVTSNL